MSELLQNHNFKFQKKYGQNFLQDVKIPRRIAVECTNFVFPEGDVIPDEKADSLILEIGPGAGILTKELAKRFKKVVAVEIDTSLEGVLKDSLAGFDNIEVVFSDILDIDLVPFLDEKRKRDDGTLMPVSVCANLPYYITTPIIMKLLEEYPDFDFITVMVQKEVAVRLCAPAGDSQYGAITAQINLFGKAKRLFTVPSGCFYPRPKIDSAVIRIELYNEPKYDSDTAKETSTVIKNAFAMRRKTLSNALSGMYKGLTKEELGQKISEILGKGTDVRGEKLSTDEFALLAASLKEYR
ncbi:MAG: ribosomal RNA small subunit methyltransferase A [Clostridia bacterium]|nr:ribosomal RNA small subunit methyltransferase A [Clostridia bacterium]